MWIQFMWIFKYRTVALICNKYWQSLNNLKCHFVNSTNDFLKMNVNDNYTKSVFHWNTHNVDRKCKSLGLKNHFNHPNNPNHPNYTNHPTKVQNYVITFGLMIPGSISVFFFHNNSNLLSYMFRCTNDLPSFIYV